MDVASYTYSRVLAADMYESGFKKDPLNAELGKLYREKVLLPGGSRDAADLLRASHPIFYRDVRIPDFG